MRLRASVDGMPVVCARKLQKIGDDWLQLIFRRRGARKRELSFQGVSKGLQIRKLHCLLGLFPALESPMDSNDHLLILVPTATQNWSHYRSFVKVVQSIDHTGLEGSMRPAWKGG
jgi:hypothetical protein